MAAKEYAEEAGKSAPRSSHCSDARDYHGRRIERAEADDDMIHVWCISPMPRGESDYGIVRCYQDAVALAKITVEDLMDDPDIEMPIEIKIWIEKMRKSDYDELLERDD